MKVSITQYSKKVISIDEARIAKEIIKGEKEDTASVEEYAKMAVRAALPDGMWVENILEASAEIVKNCRVWDAYFDGSRDLDVWITATAKTYEGFMEIGCHLTDIYKITPDNKDEFRSRAFIVRYKRA